MESGVILVLSGWGRKDADPRPLNASIRTLDLSGSGCGQAIYNFSPKLCQCRTPDARAAVQRLTLCRGSQLVLRGVCRACTTHFHWVNLVHRMQQRMHRGHLALIANGVSRLLRFENGNRILRQMVCFQKWTSSRNCPPPLPAKLVNSTSASAASGGRYDFSHMKKATSKILHILYEYPFSRLSRDVSYLLTEGRGKRIE